MTISIGSRKHRYLTPCVVWSGTGTIPNGWTASSGRRSTEQSYLEVPGWPTKETALSGAMGKEKCVASPKVRPTTISCRMPYAASRTLRFSLEDRVLRKCTQGWLQILPYGRRRCTVQRSHSPRSGDWSRHSTHPDPVTKQEVDWGRVVVQYRGEFVVLVFSERASSQQNGMCRAVRVRLVDDHGYDFHSPRVATLIRSNVDLNIQL